MMVSGQESEIKMRKNHLAEGPSESEQDKIQRKSVASDATASGERG
jgi:hypothetical protein